jgi:hypothetical protein
MNDITIDAGSGGLILGDHSMNVLDIIGGVLNGQMPAKGVISVHPR